MFHSSCVNLVSLLLMPGESSDVFEQKAASNAPEIG